MIVKAAIDNGTITLNEMMFFMEHNRSRAGATGLKLSWKFVGGVFRGQIKKDSEILFTQTYTENTLLKAMCYMHLDFWEYLNSRGSSK